MVGRNPSNRLLRALDGNRNIRIINRVDDVRDYISKSAIYVVPLRIGGGTRIKVYEAMAMGKAIVSTHIGTEGLPLEHGKHLLHADTPELLAISILKVLNDRKLRTSLETEARSFVVNECSWEKAAEVFAHNCFKVMSN